MSEYPTGRENTGAHAVGDERRKRPIWIWVIILLAAVAALLFLLSRCNNAATSSSAGPSSTTTAPSTSSASGSATTSASGSATSTSSANSGSASSSATEGASATTGATTGAAGGAASGGAATGSSGNSLTAGSTPLLPLTTSAPNRDLSKYVGQQAQARGVSVLSVPADEGFWVGTSETDRVWVQIVGKGESPYQVKAGDKVDFTAKVVGHTSTFAAQVGVDAAEGGAQLTAEKAHIEVDKGAVKLTTG